MKILIDARMWRHSGIGRYLRGLTRALVETARGHEFFGLAAAETDQGVPGVAWIPCDAPLFGAREQWALSKALKDVRPDVVHSPQMNVPLFSDVPQVTTVHDFAYDHFPEELGSWAKKAIWKWAVPRALAKSTALIADSESIRREAIERHGVDAKKITAIPLGVEDRFRKNRRTPGDFFLYVGVARPRKDLPTLLDAFARVEGRLVIVGPKDDRFLDLPKEIEQRGLTPRVELVHGASDERLLELYAGARALVFPSRYEGFGFPVLEAMACGTPVIASDIPPVREVAGDAATLVPPGNVDAFAAAMANPPPSEKGPARAAEFTWAKTAERTLQVYEEAAGARPPR